MKDVQEKILYLRDVLKMSFRQIGEQIGISRKSVSRTYRGNWDGNRVRRIPLLDKYRPLISNWFKQYPNLKASQVYEWLREREVSVSYPTVTLYTRPFRTKKEKMYHHLHFLPGEEGQVDWFFVNHPVLGKLACFVLILSYSRYLFARIFPKTQFEFFIQGHLLAFSKLNGTPHENVWIHLPVKTTKTGMMIFDTNTYSVPEYLVGKSLSIHATPTEVRVYEHHKRVATHPRSYERGTQIINPLHRTYGRLSTKAKMQRIYEVIKNLHPHLSEFLDKNQDCGEDPAKTAYEIFTLLKRESRALLIGIAKEKSPRLKTFISYLHPCPTEDIEMVHPKNTELLNIDYHPRELEAYENDSGQA